MCYDVYGKSNADVETFLLMIYHFYQREMWIGSSYEVANCTVNKYREYFLIFWILLCTSWTIQRSMKTVYFFTFNYSKFMSGSSRESVNLFCYKGWARGKQTRREAWAIRRNKLVLFTVQLQQRVNIKHSSSKSWRMLHSKFPFSHLSIIAQHRMPRGPNKVILCISQFV